MRTTLTRTPGRRAAGAGLLAAGLLLGAGASAAAVEDWPSLLGPSRNGEIPGLALTADWQRQPPRFLWRRPVGEGFAGPVVASGRVILFHRVEDEERVEAMDAATGDILWSSAHPTDYRDDFGFDEGPRSPATVAGGRVFTFGAQGVLQALDLETGRRLWSVDTVERFRVPKGFFGAACSPLVVDDRVLVNVGGGSGAGIVAFAADDGRVLWQATSDGASYSSPVLAEIGGERLALFLTREGLVALSPEDGEVRASLRWRSRSASSINGASPLVVDGRVFVSASYGTGAGLLELRGDGFRPLWKSDEALSTHYATAVHRDGTLFGFHGALHLGAPDLRAVDLASGRVRWSHRRFGGGTVLLAGDDLLILREDGALILAEASPEAFRPRGVAQILQGVARAYPAVADGVLYARSETELVAVLLQPGS